MLISVNTRPLLPDGAQALMALARQSPSAPEWLEDAARRNLPQQVARSERRSKSVEWTASGFVEVETVVSEWAAPSRAPECRSPAPKAVAGSEPAPAASASKPQGVAPTSSAEATAKHGELVDGNHWVLIREDDPKQIKPLAKSTLHRWTADGKCQPTPREAFYIDKLQRTVREKSKGWILVRKSDLDRVKAELLKNKHADQHLMNVGRSWVQ